MRYLLLLFWLLTAVNLFSQNNDTIRQNNSRAFSESKWNSIQDRWDKKQPHAQIILHSGEKIQGQIIYANSEKIVLYPGSEIMVKPSQFSDTIQIPMGRIETILLAKTKKETTLAGSLTGIAIGGGIGVSSGIIIGGGWTILPAIALGTVGIAGGWWIGSKIQKKINHKIINLDSNITNKELKVIRKYAIYKKDTILYKEINQMRAHSDVLKRVFPKKHFRIYSGISSGGFLACKNDILPVFEATDLPEIEEYRSAAVNIEILNLSWRFKNRYIVGGSMFQYSDIYLFSRSNPTANSSLDYNYSIQTFGTSLYSEYVIKPIDEYFSKRTEFSAGIGLLHLRPSFQLHYSYYNNPHEYYTDYKDVLSVYGLQLRASAAYYLFPGFSFSVGIQGNIFQNATINALYLKTSSDPNTSIKLAEHTLSFNSLRATAGIGIHF
ncbi:MAG: hypothetical protein DSY76_04105 [Bacteroidetes bacterium]|nr:MAG: hypothetical protein DSY76_04105 [Bacteroidota bacterium]